VKVKLFYVNVKCKRSDKQCRTGCTMDGLTGTMGLQIPAQMLPDYKSGRADNVTLPFAIFADTAFADTLYSADTTAHDSSARRSPIVQGAITNTNDVPVFSVYPNPTTGSLTAFSSLSGTFEVLTVTGQLVGKFVITAGTTNLNLPAILASGIYMGTYRPDNGSKPSTVRLVLKP